MPIERPLAPIPLFGNDQAVEVSLPDDAMLEADGGMIFDFGSPMPEQVAHDSNLAEHIDETELMRLGSELTAQFDADLRSRSDWEKSYIKGLDLLGLKFEDRSIPWSGACGVFHPMLSEAVVRFQSQAIQEIFPASGPVKTKIIGDMTHERVKQAQRVQTYLNYLATEVMHEYRSETEKLLFSLPIAGSAFRKVYFDRALNRPCAMFVPAEDFVVSYGASDLTTCERATHIMKRTENQVRKLQVSGFYRDIDLPAPAPDLSEIQRKYDELTGDSENYEFDSRHRLLEMQVELDLPGFEDPDGVALPYVVTIDKSSGMVLAIYRNWYEGDQARLKRDHFVHYQYLPGLGFYGFGLVHMIGGLSKSATSLLRQLIDSGTLSNLPGGLKSRGLRIKGDDTPIMPGEFRDVDVPSGAIRDNITFLPYKEPSNVLYQLLADIVQEGRRFASAADVKAADINGEAPVGTTLAILEREMKVMSAIQARLHASMGDELKILADIVVDWGVQRYPFEIEGQELTEQDFDERVDIVPVSDPNAGTMAQRIMQYQAALQLAAQAPQMYNMPLLHRQMLEVLGIQGAENIVPTDEDVKPSDPVTENMSILNQKPVKAFMYQDHEAHIQTHVAAMKNPEAIELLKENPVAPAIQAAMNAHIAEHLAFLYRSKIEKELGVPLPGPDEPLPEDIELRLSRLVAPAAAQLTGKAQRQAQAEQQAKQQQDPIFQMQMRELQIKEQKEMAAAQAKEREIALKEQQAMAKVQLDMAKLQKQLEQDMSKEDLEYAKLELQRMLGEAQVAAKIGGDQLDAMSEQERLTSQQAIEGYRMGLQFVSDLMKTKKDNQIK
jgi:hypothetical protein